MNNPNQDNRKKIYHGETGVWRFQTTGEQFAEMIFGKDSSAPKCYICQSSEVVAKDDTGRHLCDTHSHE